MGPFDEEAARTAIENFTVTGGTAIGLALEAGYKALYQTGCVRKHVICITDGENTSGPDPAPVARTFYEATHGDVELHFVAFDTSPKKFGFLTAVNGSVVEASDGAQLGGRLSEIYERRILVEEMPAEHE
jgi:Mg-chelatase subunit ChlD